MVLSWALATAFTCGVACGSDDDGTASNFGNGGKGGGAGDAQSDAPSWDSVTVEPPTATLTIALGQTGTQAYQAFGEKNGQKSEITTECSWGIDQTFGSFASPGSLSAKPKGGETNVVATCGGSQGTSKLTIELTGSVVLPTAPTGIEALFAAATAGTDPNLTPVIEYPLSGAVAPRNIPSVEAQWSAAGNDAFKVSIAGTYLAIDIYSGAPEAQLADADWTSVVESANGGAVTYTVEGLSTAAPATKYASAGASLTLSTDRIDDTAIYWWASSKGSLLSQTFGESDAPDSVKADCTSCHSVSRAGTRIGYSRCVAGDCGQLYGGFMKYDTATKAWVEKVDANNKAIQGSYSTFAPVGNPFADDSKAVALFAMSAGGLELYDPDTGAVAASNVGAMSVMDPAGTPATRTATMPDWSPDGTQVVFASTPNAGQWIDVSTSALAVMAYTYPSQVHTFSAPTFLVSQPITLANGTYDNFFFPSFSADGEVIVFNAARGAWRNSTDARAPGQRLMLTNKDGTNTRDLANMNGPGDLNITWPHWAPSASSDYLWIVFSSERDYGHRITQANTDPSCLGNGVKQCKQIWIGAIDKTKLAGAEDPSAAPVWMPGQDLTADNISPYWTLPTSKIPK